MKIDFGAGKFPAPGYKTLDKFPPADIICDLTKEKIPLPDNSVEEGNASNLLEHFSSGDEIISVMNEIWRVMEPGGIFHAIVPRAPLAAAFRDPTHKSFWVLESFHYYNYEHPHWKMYGSAYGIKPWKILKLKRKKEFICCDMTPLKESTCNK